MKLMRLVRKLAYTFNPILDVVLRKGFIFLALATWMVVEFATIWQGW